MPASSTANGVRPRAQRAIGDAPEMFRLVTRGAVDRAARTGVVDRDAEPAGAIRGLSVITLGEANGWWLDDEFIDGVLRLGLERGRVKARFTHPGMSADGLGTQLGRVTRFRRTGDQVYGDLEFIQAATHSPHGDLPAYVMDLAEEVPEDFGTSIVFRRDGVAEERFRAEHTDATGAFRSPDARNVDHLEHIRIAMLRAVDAVDVPAANPDGLFDGQTSAIAASADELVAYALGLSAEPPRTNVLGVHHDRARTYLQGFLSRRQLVLTDAAAAGAASTTEEEAMELKAVTLTELRAQRSDLVDQLRAELVAEGRTSAEKDAEKGVADQVAQLSAQVAEATAAGAKAERARLAELKAAYPADVAFALEQYELGATPEQAKNAFRDLENKKLKAEVAALSKRVGAAPVGFAAEPEGEKSHLDRAKAYRAEHKCSMSVALSATAARR